VPAKSPEVSDEVLNYLDDFGLDTKEKIADFKTKMGNCELSFKNENGKTENGTLFVFQNGEEVGIFNKKHNPRFYSNNKRSAIINLSAFSDLTELQAL
jgi:hypothetical protein